MKKRIMLSVLILITALLGMLLVGCFSNKITSLTVAELPAKTNYYVGETEISLGGGVIEAKYQNGTAEFINMNNGAVSHTGFDTGATGTITITLTYKEAQCQFNITVAEKAVTGIEVTKLPDKTEYGFYGTFEPQGGIVKVTYEDNSTAELDMDSGLFTFTYEFYGAGTSAVVISYLTFTDEFEVTVVETDIPDEVQAIINMIPEIVLASISFMGEQHDYMAALYVFLPIAQEVLDDPYLSLWMNKLTVFYHFMERTLADICDILKYEYENLLATTMASYADFYVETLLPLIVRWMNAGGSTSGYFCDREIYPEFDDDMEAMWQAFYTELDDYAQGDLLTNMANMNVLMIMSADHYGSVLSAFEFSFVYDNLYQAKLFYGYWQIGAADLSYFFVYMTLAITYHDYFDTEIFDGLQCGEEYLRLEAFFYENYTEAPDGYDWETLSYLFNGASYETGIVSGVVYFVYYYYAIADAVESVYDSENEQWIKYFELMYAKQFESYTNYLNAYLFDHVPEFATDAELIGFLRKLSYVVFNWGYYYYASAEELYLDVEILLGLYEGLSGMQIASLARANVAMVPDYFTALVREYHLQFVDEESATVYQYLFEAELYYLAWLADGDNIFCDSFVLLFEEASRLYLDLSITSKNEFDALYEDYFEELTTAYLSILP